MKQHFVSAEKRATFYSLLRFHSPWTPVTALQNETVSSVQDPPGTGAARAGDTEASSGRIGRMLKRGTQGTGTISGGSRTFSWFINLKRNISL